MDYPIGYYSYQNPNNYIYQAVPTSALDLDVNPPSPMDHNANALFFQQQQQHHHHQQQQQLHLQQQHNNNKLAIYPAQPTSPPTQHSMQQHFPIQQQLAYHQQIQSNRKRQLESPTMNGGSSTSSSPYLQTIYSPIQYSQKPPSATAANNGFQQAPLSPQPLHVSPNSLSFIGVPSQNYQPPSPPSDHMLDEDIEDQLREYLAPLFVKHLDQTARDHLANLLADFFNEEMTLSVLFNELRGIALDDRPLLQYLIEIFIVVDTTNKMYPYLTENGVNEQELNIDTKNISMLFDPEGGFFKKRDRSRKSVSRGLRNPPNKWTKEESQRLIQLVHESGDKQWKKIALQIGGGKTGAQCAQHWKRVLCPAIRKGSWDEEEEAKLFVLVEKHGQSWKNVALEIRTRTDIQCRYQYFKSCMSREVPWSPKEDELLQKKVIECKQEGREISWMDISKSMARARQTKIPRTALECKSRWDSIALCSIVE
ncbi:myb transcription factor [Cavenderia fasciculata]|uniref:Myb transcription factor n=1 Tax=Cavenderia fasciculata TaxID=261658 RepID=F4PUD0_CACFS|nr:myb transcription factor [Cavenderia fasciculata]EGG21845.1 myb transcription factor [Cavenderia fasciculata]|eukprot:XP_004359696.1 myb transcription factor [Cavenderia fasciculata]